MSNRLIRLGLCVALFAAFVMGTPLTKQVPEQMTTSARIRSLDRRHNRLRIRQQREDGQLDSYNWAGYAVTGANGSATDVKGSWYVPTVNCSQSPDNSASSFWIGIDGFSSETVEQIGTDSDCDSARGSATGTPTYYAWFELFPGPSYEIQFSRGVHPGDAMTAEVKYVGEANSRGRDSGPEFTLTLTDVTQNESYSVSAIVPGAAQSSVEWVLEAPETQSGVVALADFGQLLAGSAEATLHSLTGGISTFGANIQELTMVADTASHPIEAQPSNLNSSGTNFSVAWLSSGR